MHLIIDADPIVYRCGFAAERTEYHIVYEEDDGLHEIHFAPDGNKSAGDFMRPWKVHNGAKIVSQVRDVHPDTKEKAHEAVRTQLYSIEKAVREHFNLSAFGRIDVILSGPNNYRDKLATLSPYKGNRDPEYKPHWYQSIRDYLTSEWGARVIAGREADDECSIIAQNLRRSDTAYCVSTIDKDLDQIPGNHYNYLKQVFHAQSTDAAERFFYQQCLSGDSTDGIGGCWRVGDTGAKKFIEEIWDNDSDATVHAGGSPVLGGRGRINSSRTKHGLGGRNDSAAAISHDTASGDSKTAAASGRLSSKSDAGRVASPRQSADSIAGDVHTRVRGGPVGGAGSAKSDAELPVPGATDSGRLRHAGVWDAIVARYTASLKIAGCPYADRDPAAVALEVARLVYIQQNEGELWNPPTEPMGRLPEYTEDDT